MNNVKIYNKKKLLINNFSKKLNLIMKKIYKLRI